MTQAQRNQAEWARTVVQGASVAAGGPTRSIPSTQASPNDYMWVNDPVNFPYVIGLSAPIQNVSVGWILQLKMFSGTPHTFIVSGKDANGVWMLDSNWSSNNDEIIRNHYKSFTDFTNTFQNWSYYYIQ